jgi:hypothetical protein
MFIADKVKKIFEPQRGGMLIPTIYPEMQWNMPWNLSLDVISG